MMAGNSLNSYSSRIGPHFHEPVATISSMQIIKIQIEDQQHDTIQIGHFDPQTHQPLSLVIQMEDRGQTPESKVHRQSLSIICNKDINYFFSIFQSPPQHGSRAGGAPISGSRWDLPRGVQDRAIMAASLLPDHPCPGYPPLHPLPRPHLRLPRPLLQDRP